MTLKESVQQFVKTKKAYYKQWMFDEPLVISNSHNNELQRLQKIMYRLIQEFVNNYQQYKHLMPVSDKIENIINTFNKKEYNIGTYRTDFVYDENKQVKIIEITCRFALNGMFLSALINDVALDYYTSKINDIKILDIYSPIYNHFETYLKDVKSICILKGKDIKNESKVYIDIFERMGYPVKEIQYTEVENYWDILKESWIISELSFDEILSFPDQTIKDLSDVNIINDFRTIFLIHDKRFFSVLGKEELQNKVLNSDEINFFRRFYIPTYTALEKDNIWKEAKGNKNSWIVKHRALGKSQKIYAGIVTDEEKWKTLFESENKKDMILQEWIPQTKIKGNIGNEHFEDYVTGTLLFFDDNYFGFGDFRTSSHPVTNKVDHRKVSSLISSNNQIPENITNFIV